MAWTREDFSLLFKVFCYEALALIFWLGVFWGAMRLLTGRW